MSSVDHYATLGLRPGASDDQIRKAFRRLALIHHPDKNPGDVQAASRFRRIAEAYHVLGDSKRRYAYDSVHSGRDESAYVHDPYLRVALEKSLLSLNEEVLLTVCFPSEGRAFRKPVLEGWEIAAGPAVSHRIENGHRETVLQYTLCPLRTGRLVVPAMRIHFHGRAVWSDPLEVEAKSAACWFSNGLAAGQDPFRIRLYKLHEIRSARFTKTVVVPRSVLVPRSDLAAYYHRIGRTLKIAFPLLIAPLALMQGFSVLIGLLAGSLFAGLNVRLMYRMMGVKPRCGHALRFPAVVSRLDEGYFFGSSPPLWSGTTRQLRFRWRDWLL